MLGGVNSIARAEQSRAEENRDHLRWEARPILVLHTFACYGLSPCDCFFIFILDLGDDKMVC